MYDFLKGVRVLDLTTVALGPFATQYLGDFGADVIKVESPAGDIYRYIRPSRSEDMGAGFLNMNRNKRSVCLDLKDNDDLARFHVLLNDADVLVHNMRASAATRLGIGAEQLRESHPRLVYCGAPGFGSDGRYAGKPAYDDIIQAASGTASLNSNSKGEPQFVPMVLCDKVGALHLAMAVLAGITHQEKTGNGCVIESPMFEGMVSFVMAEHLSGETYRPSHGPPGYERLLTPYRRPHRTKDSFISVLPYSGEQWLRVLDLLNSDLASQDWVKSSSARSDRVGELYAVLAAAMPERTTDEWIEIFTELDVPCTKVNSMEDLLTDGHLNDVGLFYETDHPSEGPVRAIRSPYRVEGVEYRKDIPAPNRENDIDSVGWNVKR